MKALLDTNVLIEFFRDPGKRVAFELKAERPLLYMSSVVAMELRAGCRNRKEEVALSAFLRPFEKARRIVTPNHATFVEAGRVLAMMGKDGLPSAARRRLVNDVVIAVSAARAGVVVVTRNRKDFERIGRWMPVRWMAPEAGR